MFYLMYVGLVDCHLSFINDIWHNVVLYQYNS